MIVRESEYCQRAHINLIVKLSSWAIGTRSIQFFSTLHLFTIQSMLKTDISAIHKTNPKDVNTPSYALRNSKFYNFSSHLKI
jgi:hypothetical protein